VRICIVGAGSIGSFVGARLAATGAEVTFVARGNTLRALQSAGLRLIEADGSSAVHRLRAVGNVLEAGAQDIVILATKAHQVAAVVDDLPALWHRETVLVTMQNGIPWWYFQGLAGPHNGRPVHSVDPGGSIGFRIPADRILGCVVYPACEAPAPGVIRHVEGDRFALGELDGSLSTRAARVGALFEAGGLKAPVLRDIRSEIWLKLWGNLCFNPISALTRATLAGICREPHARAVAAGMMEEARSVAEKLGATFRVSAERRIEGAARVGEHRTSMLQDVEAGRATEIDALLGAVIELAQVTHTPVPRLEAVYACTKLLERTVCAGAQPAHAAPQAAAA
jgi:2-dehydropantoate 2-reductase